MNKINVQELEEQLKSALSDFERVDVLNLLVAQLGYQDADQMLTLSQEAYALANSYAYQGGITDSLINLSKYYSTQSDFTEAFSLANQALSLARTMGDVCRQLKSLTELSNVTHRVSDFTKSIEFALQILEIAQASGERLYQATAYNLIANNYNRNGDSRSALESYERALAIYQDAGDPYKSAVVLSNISFTHRLLDQYTLALEKAQTAHVLLSQTIERYPLAINLGVLGNIYQAVGDHHQALLYHQQKLTIVEELDNDYMRAYTFGDIGRVYLAQGQLEEALTWLEAGIEIAKNKGLEEALLKNYESIIKVYKAQPDYQQALAYYERYTAVKDQLFNTQADQRRKLLMVQYETQQAQMEAQFQKQRAEDSERRAAHDRQYFEELAKLKQEFISSAAHDLKNPLTSITINAQLLRRKVDSSLERYLTQIESQANRMNTLIVDMLDLARLETGQALQMTFASMVTLLTGLVEEFKTLARHKDITTHLQCADDLSFYFDVDNMRRALGNLLSNAIKYSPQGAQVTIQASLSDGYIVIDIVDTGFGIPEKDLPYIFDRFYRVQNTETVQIEGTGLGLAVAKTIVEQHHGTITVESQVGQGTKFHVSLPTNYKQ